MKGPIATAFRWMRIPVSDYRVVVEPHCGQVLLEGEISTAEAAELLGCSVRHIQALCDEGVLKEVTEWRKVAGRAAGGKVYRIKRSAVLRLRLGEIEGR